MKNIKCLLLIIISNFVQAQSINITVIDKSTLLSIEDVNISLLNGNEGTVTNSEGKAVLNFKGKSDLKISNINYEDIFINTDNLKKIDTIYLIQKVILLDEVKVSNFNLSKALQYVLDNYSSLYVDVPFENDCDFKETVEIDGKLKRLIVTKVNWWDKSYKREKNDVKFRLGLISYNKNEPFEIFSDVPRLNKPSNSGFINLSSVVNTIYLNVLLKTLIPYLANAEVNLEESPKDLILVSFKTESITGKITFDKKTKAINRIDYEIIYKSNIVKDIIKENKKESIVETKKSFLSATFYKSLNNKLSLKIYESGNNLTIAYDNKNHDANFINKIYVLNEKNSKKVGNDGLIDLKKPIYESLPSTEIKSTNTILLDSKEKEFMFSIN